MVKLRLSGHDLETRDPSFEDMIHILIYRVDEERGFCEAWEDEVTLNEELLDDANFPIELSDELSDDLDNIRNKLWDIKFRLDIAELGLLEMDLMRDPNIIEAELGITSGWIDNFEIDLGCVIVLLDAFALELSLAQL